MPQIFRQSPLRQLYDEHPRESLKTGLWIFDFDGTLVDFHEDPAKVALSHRVRSALELLSHKLTQKIIIMSGRRISDLKLHFDENDYILIGEHGGDSNFLVLPSDIRHFHQSPAEKYLQMLCDKYTGSFVEEKKFSRVYHYRSAINPPSSAEVERFIKDLDAMLNESSLICTDFNMAIEVKDKACSKLEIVNSLMQSSLCPTTLLSFGDDHSEREIFEAYPDKVLSIAVGERIPHAHYRCSSPQDLGLWLEEISKEL